MDNRERASTIYGSSHRSSLLTDKSCVVIDIGHIYTKLASDFFQCEALQIELFFRIGMSGEPAPRYIIRSKAHLRLSGKVGVY